MKNFKILRILALSCAALWACATAHANDLDYLQRVTPPVELPSLDSVFSNRSTYYLKIPNYFGSELVETKDARLKLAPGEYPSIFVQFKSNVVAAAIEEQLKARGLKIAENREQAGFILGGEVLYHDQFFPNPPRRLAINEKLNPDASQGPANKTVSLAAFELAPYYLTRSASPAAFGAQLLEKLFDVTGANKVFNSSTNKNTESFLLLDCYDKTTRKSSSCIGEGQMLLSYRGKVRVQAINLKAFFGKPGASASEYQRVNIISRAIDGRNSTGNNLTELLASAVTELIEPLGHAPVLNPQAVDAQAKPESEIVPVPPVKSAD